MKVEGGAKFLGDGRVVRRCAAPGSKAVRGVAVKPESVVHRRADIPIIRSRVFADGSRAHLAIAGTEIPAKAPNFRSQGRINEKMVEDEGFETSVPVRGPTVADARTAALAVNEIARQTEGRAHIAAVF